MQKIGFFGGCFNPPTIVHIEIANNLIKNKKLDKVIFIPVNDYYIKDDLTLATHRLKMLELAIKDYKNIEVDNIEIKENKKLYAADAIKIIENSKYNKDEKFFIMGSDNFNKMPTWKNYDEIKDKYKYIVIERNSEIISATEIRKMFKEKNNKVKEYLTKEVYEYIIKNKIY